MGKISIREKAKWQQENLNFIGEYPEELVSLAKSWVDNGREFYLGPENIFDYNMIQMNYIGSEKVSKEWGSWAIFTNNQTTSLRLSKNDLDEIAYTFGKNCSVKSAILWIGSKCNLSCSFCLYHGKDKKYLEYRIFSRMYRN